MAGIKVSRGVARSASKNPVNVEVPLNRPLLTAAPLPGREQPMSEMGTLLFEADSLLTTEPVSSELPLSTTTMREFHACASRKSSVLWSVDGSRPASLYAGMMTSKSTTLRRCGFVPLHNRCLFPTGGICACSVAVRGPTEVSGGCTAKFLRTVFPERPISVFTPPEPIV